jgi:hypothetical protein
MGKWPRRQSIGLLLTLTLDSGPEPSFADRRRALL